MLRSRTTGVGQQEFQVYVHDEVNAPGTFANGPPFSLVLTMPKYAEIRADEPV